MTLVKELLGELIGMFIGSARLTIAILALVALAAGVIQLAGIEPLIAGAALLLGCLILLVENVRRSPESRPMSMAYRMFAAIRRRLVEQPRHDDTDNLDIRERAARFTYDRLDLIARTTYVNR